MKKLLILFFGAVIAFANLGFAHSPVAFVIPKDGSVIKQAPDKMEIAFTAPAQLIKLEFSRVMSNEKSSLIGGLLGSEKLEAIDLGKSHLMKKVNRHVINMPMLDLGLYKTTWRALSEDGHVIKGEFAFEISAEGADASSAGAEFFTGEGKIKRVRGSRITIKHGALGDLMPAMTMEYDVAEAGPEMDFKRGDTVVFKINKDLEIVSIQQK
jgi:methionine-rich copper-binding protein CopC